MRSTIRFRMAVWGGGDQGNRRGQSSLWIYATSLISRFQVFQSFLVPPLPQQKLHPPSPIEKLVEEGWGLVM